MAIKKIKDKIRIKNILKNNKRLFLGFFIGLILSSSAVYGATILFDSDDVSYDDSKVTSSSLGSSTVQGALDALYNKANNCGPSYYALVNVTNGTVSSSANKLSNGSGTISITPTSDYGCNPSIDECDYNCTNGVPANVSSNGQTLTISGARQSTECNVTLTRNSNFSYSTETGIASLDRACCSASMPSFSTSYGTYKVVGTVYDTNHAPLSMYCVNAFYDYNTATAGSSCTAYSTKIVHTDSCVAASTDSSYVCGQNGTIRNYNATVYTSDRTHTCGHKGENFIECPNW